MQTLGIGDDHGLGRDDNAELDFGILGAVLDIREGAVLVVGVILVVSDLKFGLGEEKDMLGWWDDSDCSVDFFLSAQILYLSLYQERS